MGFAGCLAAAGLCGARAAALLEQVQSRPELAPLAGRLLHQAIALNRRLPGLRRQLRPQVGVVPLGPAHVTIQTLGRMEVRINSRLVTGSDWRSLVARDLFFFLLDHPQGLSKEQIGLELWPDASPDQLQQRFRNLIYRLRHAVGSEVIVLGPGEIYQFNTGLDYEYDVETFERELELALRKENPETRLDHLIKAIHLYQGAYLPEIDAEWALVERERLKQRCLDGLHQRGQPGVGAETPRAGAPIQQARHADRSQPGRNPPPGDARLCHGRRPGRRDPPIPGLLPGDAGGIWGRPIAANGETLRRINPVRE